MPSQLSETRTQAIATATGVEVSVILPCLDEEATVGAVVDEAFAGLERAGVTGEVIVVDNGSTDDSALIAADHGAQTIFASFFLSILGLRRKRA
ncbi:hypothetical protein BH18ACT13_BH18ACT13_19070 [soil metagenome]